MMKTIELPDPSPEFVGLFDQAGDDDLVVRLGDGREFLVVAVDEFDREVARTRGNPKLMALLDERARQTAAVSLEEIKERLGL